MDAHRLEIRESQGLEPDVLCCAELLSTPYSTNAACTRLSAVSNACARARIHAQRVTDAAVHQSSSAISPLFSSDSLHNICYRTGSIISRAIVPNLLENVRHNQHIDQLCIDTQLSRRYEEVESRSHNTCPPSFTTPAVAFGSSHSRCNTPFGCFYSLIIIFGTKLKQFLNLRDRISAQPSSEMSRSSTGDVITEAYPGPMSVLSVVSSALMEDYLASHCERFAQLTSFH